MAVSENGSHSIVLANSFVKESLVPFVVHDAELGRDVTKPQSTQIRLLLINELNCLSAGVMRAPPNGACRYARRGYAESPYSTNTSSGFGPCRGMCLAS